MRSATLLILLLVGTAIAQTPPTATPKKPAPQDGAGKVPKAISKPTSKAATKVGAFDAVKLSELTARVQYLTAQLNQSLIAAERYAHTSPDKEMQRRTHIRFAALITGLQTQWHKMSAMEHVTDGGVPLMSLTAAKGMAADS